ncbi:MAG: glycosyltransferase family 4 protein [Sulfuricaulis sp.]|uniref:glycosyltransferase family 4 protein n=1 Tax=Sulfuricaulis sp. TaxID=2003553 RepID=UPI0034A4AD99
MKVLIVTQYFHPENFRVNDLAEWLAERGHEVTVLTGIPNYPSGRYFSGYGLFKRRMETWNCISVVRVPQVPRGGGGVLRLALNYISFAVMASLYGLYRLRGRYDVIFVHEPSPITVGIPAIVMRKRSGAPIFFWVLDLWPESIAAAGDIHASWMLDLLEKLTRWIYSHCKKVLVASRAFIPRVGAMGVSEDRIVYFPNWAEAIFQPSVDIEPPVPLPRGFRVMFAGNIGVAQDFPAVLEAAERLKGYPDIHWIVLGDGRMGEWVREAVVRRGIVNTVHLLGSYPPEQMPRFFAHADVMLVSLKRSPIFALTIPGKIQSYLACGRPIVAMLDGEGAWVVKESGAGLTCAAEDADGLADAVLTLANMPKDQREAMGRKGRYYFEANFTRDMLFRNLETWMTESIKEKKQ